MLLESDPKPLGEDVSVQIPAGGRRQVRQSPNAMAPKGRSGDARAAGQGRPAKTDAARAPSRPSQMRAAPTARRAKDTTTSAASATARLRRSRPAATPSRRCPARRRAPLQRPRLRPRRSSGAKRSAGDPRRRTPTPKANARADAKSDGAGAFSVQLAAFSDDKGANALVEQAEEARAIRRTPSRSTTSKGTLWRVRVGPYASRDAAATSRDKLKGEGYNGIVASAN